MKFKVKSGNDIIKLGAVVSGKECYIDNFRLFSEPVELLEVYKNLIDEKRLTLEGINGTLNIKLNEKIESTLSYTSNVEENIDSLEKASLLLYNLEKEVLLMQPVYKQMNDDLHLYSNLLNVTDASSEEKNSYNEVIEEIKKELPEVERVEDVFSMQQQLNEACIQYMNIARLIDGKTADMSFLIKDHFVTETSDNWINKVISRETSYNNALDNVYYIKDNYFSQTDDNVKVKGYRATV